MSDASVAQLGVFAGAALSVVFVAAAAGKLQDPAAFRESLGGYGFVPKWSVAPIASLIPALELALAAGLLVPRLRPAGGFTSLGLLAAFTVVVGIALARGAEVDCGCFGGGGGPERASRLSIARNLVLMALALVAVLSRPAGHGDSLPAVLSGAGVGMVIVIADRALALFRRYWLRPEQVVR